MTKENIIDSLITLIPDYTLSNVENTVINIKKLWLMSDDRRTTWLVKEEQKKEAAIKLLNET